MENPFLTPDDLATRWTTKTSTLSQWRWNGRGPRFFKIERLVRYHIQDIETFEQQKQRQHTSLTFVPKVSTDPIKPF